MTIKPLLRKKQFPECVKLLLGPQVSKLFAVIQTANAVNVHECGFHIGKSLNTMGADVLRTILPLVLPHLSRYCNEKTVVAFENEIEGQKNSIDTY